MSGEGPVALLCGGGDLPLEAADAIARAGREALLIGIKGAASKAIEQRRHGWVGIGEVGRLFKLLEGAGARDVVVIGAIKRPALRDIRFDMTGLGLLPEVRRVMQGGDDELLRWVIGYLETRGCRLRGVHEVAPGLTAAEGLMGQVEATREDATSVAAGMAVLAALGPYDIGQAVVAYGRRIIAVEAAEGTDAMLKRVARLAANGRFRRESARGGVLIKMPKRGQDLRIDLPAIGPRTIELAGLAGLTGVAVAAGHVLIAERARVPELADGAGLFLAGVPLPPELASQ